MFIFIYNIKYNFILHSYLSLYSIDLILYKFNIIYGMIVLYSTYSKFSIKYIIIFFKIYIILYCNNISYFNIVI